MKALRETFQEIARTTRKDWDWFGAVTGMKRRGKSSLVYELAEIIEEELHSRIWVCYSYWEGDDEEQTIHEDREKLGLTNTNIWPASVQYAMEHAGPGDVVWLDEAVGIIHKYKWNTPECKNFIDLCDMYGWKNLIVFMLQPEFSDFTKGFRTSRIKMHIWVRQRGIARVRIPKETVNGVEWKHATTWEDTFPKLTDEKEARYRAIKECMLARRTEETGNGTLKAYKQEVHKRIEETWPDALQKEIAYVIGVSEPTIGRWRDKL